jgi:hypothetical protein
MATRAKNTSMHPGNNKVLKQKRCTKDKIRVVREKEEAAKEAKALKRLQVAKCIGNIEKQIQEAEVDVDKTFHQALPHTHSQT